MIFLRLRIDIVNEDSVLHRNENCKSIISVDRCQNRGTHKNERFKRKHLKQILTVNIHIIHINYENTLTIVNVSDTHRMCT